MLIKELFSNTNIINESEIVVKFSLSKLDKFVKHTMSELEKDFKSEEVDNKSVGAAPNTQSFKAIKYGMIEYSPNTKIHQQYGGAINYNHFFKMGTAITLATRREIRDEFIADFEDEFDFVLDKKSVTAFKTSDGVSVTFVPDEGGTAWVGFGFNWKK